ncbi:hypothetical protein BA5240_2981, partial [Bacillus anthracis]
YKRNKRFNFQFFNFISYLLPFP